MSDRGELDLETIEFLSTNMSDRKRCERCRELIPVREIEQHAAGHGYTRTRVRIEQGMRI